MKLVGIAGVLVFILCMFASVSHAQTVQADFDRSFDFSRLKTFNFSLQRRGAGDPLAKDSLNDGRIKAALESKLAASGYRRETAQRADFAVAYYVMAKDKLDVQDYSFGPRRWLGGRDIRVDQYTEGTLIVDLIDVNTKQLIWRGRASGAVELKNMDKKIDKAVEKLVKQFLKDASAKAGK
jgi:hypothetical protein